jgi:hypothetical protein
MTDIEERIRELAHRLWEQAGQPHGRSEEFWYAAEQEIVGGVPLGEAEPLVEEPPELAAQHGVATGMPGERIAEQGVLDDRLAELVLPHPNVAPERNP